MELEVERMIVPVEDRGEIKEENHSYERYLRY